MKSGDLAAKMSYSPAEVTVSYTVFIRWLGNTSIIKQPRHRMRLVCTSLLERPGRRDMFLALRIFDPMTIWH